MLLTEKVGSTKWPTPWLDIVWHRGIKVVRVLSPQMWRYPSLRFPPPDHPNNGAHLRCQQRFKNSAATCLSGNQSADEAVKRFHRNYFLSIPFKKIYSVLKLLTVFCGLSRVKRTFFLGTRWRSWNFFTCHKQKLCNDWTPLMIRGKAWFLELGEPNLLRFARNDFHPIVLDLNIWNSMTKDMNQICLQAKYRLLWFKNKDGLDRLAN